MGQTDDSPATQNTHCMSSLPRRYSCRKANTQQARRSSGEPCDINVSSTVRGGLRHEVAYMIVVGVRTQYNPVFCYWYPTKTWGKGYGLCFTIALGTM